MPIFKFPPIVYLAARYSRRDELRSYAADLRSAGYLVVCDWVNGDHDHTTDIVAAEIDLAEVSHANIVISFTEPPGEVKGRGRGGRHVEFGVALALRKRCIVVGYRENVFHHLPAVEFYTTWVECIARLSNDAAPVPMEGEISIAQREAKRG